MARQESRMRRLEIDGFDEAEPHEVSVAGLTGPVAAVPGPVFGASATVEDIEDLLADLQLERSGLAGADPEPAVRRVGRLIDEVAFLGLSRLVAELTGDGVTAPARGSALDLEAGEDGRRASYDRWRAEARGRVGPVWEWLSMRRRNAGSRPWWCSGPGLPLPADSVRQLADVAVPVPDVSPIAETWGLEAGLREATAEHNWRWLMLGKGLFGAEGPPGPPMPRRNELLTRLVLQARDRGLLPSAHKVKLIGRAGTPPRVTPVRLPGRSLLSLPAGVTPVTFQYLQHAIAHVAEHAARPAHAPLAKRWSLDPLRSEGWAMLLGYVVQSPEMLVRLGLEDHCAEVVAGFLAEEERFSRGLMAADVALEAELADCRSADAALDAAAAVAARTGLSWAPERLLLRQTRMRHWRSCLAGYAWRDAVLDRLTARFGTGWAERDEAWTLLRQALTSTGSAAEFLDALGTDTRPRRPVELRPAFPEADRLLARAAVAVG